MIEPVVPAVEVAARRVERDRAEVRERQRLTRQLADALRRRLDDPLGRAHVDARRVHRLAEACGGWSRRRGRRSPVPDDGDGRVHRVAGMDRERNRLRRRRDELVPGARDRLPGGRCSRPRCRSARARRRSACSRRARPRPPSSWTVPRRRTRSAESRYRTPARNDDARTVGGVAGPVRARGGVGERSWRGRERGGNDHRCGAVHALIRSVENVLNMPTPWRPEGSPRRAPGSRTSSSACPAAT